MKHASKSLKSGWPYSSLGLLLALLTGLTLFLPVSVLAENAKRINSLGMTFIRIQPGTFIMGSPETERLRDHDEHQHEKTITSAFYLQETEVTLGQWEAVMGRRWFMRQKGGDTMPVTRVSWYDCIDYIKKLNALEKRTYRLPTEAEWEYACRANTTTAYSWGDGIDCSKAAYGNNTKKDRECIPYLKGLGIQSNSPAPVKTFAPNPWGLYDMHGNVWEWCQDIYSEDLAAPAGPNYSGINIESRVRRGGSWYKHAQYLRSANRTYAHPGAKFKTTGFRLVLEAD